MFTNNQQTIKDLVKNAFTKDFLNISNNIIIAIDSLGNIVMANKKAYQSFGYKEKEVVGKSWFDFISKEELKLIKPHFIKVFQGKAKIKKHYEGAILTKNGEWRNALWSNHLLRDENKRPIGILSFGEDITEYKRSLEEKKLSEYKYHNLFEFANDAIFVADIKTGNIFDANKKAEQLIGRPLKEIIGMHQSELHSPEQREMHKNKFRQAIRNKQFFIEDVYVTHRDGHDIPVNISTSVFRVNSHCAIQGIFRNMSKQKEIEEQIKNSENLYHSLVDFIGLGVEMVDLDGRILFQNKYLKDKIGKNVIGQKCWLVYRDNKKQCTECPLKKEIKIGQKGRVKAAGCLNGKTLLMDYRWINYQNKIVLLKVVRDITQQEEWEKILKTSEEKLKTVTEQIPDALFVFDLEDTKIPFKIIDTNYAACKMHGYGRQELLGKSITFLDDPTAAGKVIERRKKLLQEKNLHFEVLHQKKNGVLFPVEVRIRLIEFGGKKIAIAVDRDITWRKKNEEEKLKYNNELEKMNSFLVDRETKMIELKEKIKQLENSVNKT